MTSQSRHSLVIDANAEELMPTRVDAHEDDVAHGGLLIAVDGGGLPPQSGTGTLHSTAAATDPTVAGGLLAPVDAAMHRGRRRSSQGSMFRDDDGGDGMDDGGSAAQMIQRRVEELYHTGVALLRSGRNLDAVRIFGRLAFLAPHEPLCYVSTAEAYAAMHDLRSAVVCVRKALRLIRDPVSAADLKVRLSQMLDTLGVVAFREQRFALALQYADASINEVKTPHATLHRAMALAGMGRLDDADAVLVTLVAETSGMSVAPTGVTAASGVVLPTSTATATGAPSAAAATSAVVAVANPPPPMPQIPQVLRVIDADARVLRVQIALQRRDFLTSRHLLEMARSVHPNHPRLEDAERLFDSVFQIFREEAQQTLDTDCLSRCVQCFPDDAELYRLRAVAYVNRKQYTLAISDLFACIQKSGGSNPVATSIMGSTLATIAHELAEIEDYAAAANYFTESLKWAEGAVEVLVARGGCYSALSKHEDALNDYKAALSVDPTNVTVKKELALLHDRWGTVLFNEKHFPLAEAEFGRAILYDAEEPTFAYHRALARMMLKQPILAMRDLLTAKELGIRDPQALAMCRQYCEGGGGASAAAIAHNDPSDELVPRNILLAKRPQRNRQTVAAARPAEPRESRDPDVVALGKLRSGTTAIEDAKESRPCDPMVIRASVARMSNLPRGQALSTFATAAGKSHAIEGTTSAGIGGVTKPTATWSSGRIASESRWDRYKVSDPEPVPDKYAAATTALIERANYVPPSGVAPSTDSHSTPRYYAASTASNSSFKLNDKKKGHRLLPLSATPGATLSGSLRDEPSRDASVGSVRVDRGVEGNKKVFSPAPPAPRRAAVSAPKVSASANASAVVPPTANVPTKTAAAAPPAAEQSNAEPNATAPTEPNAPAAADASRSPDKTKAALIRKKVTQEGKRRKPASSSSKSPPERSQQREAVATPTSVGDVQSISPLT